MSLLTTSYPIATSASLIYLNLIWYCILHPTRRHGATRFLHRRRGRCLVNILPMPCTRIAHRSEVLCQSIDWCCMSRRNFEISTKLANIVYFNSPLCIEEFDLSDRNFRPCPCGYQVWITFQVFVINLKSLPYSHESTVGLSVLLQQHQKQHEWPVSSM